MRDADSDERPGMGGRREGVMDRSGAVAFFVCCERRNCLPREKGFGLGDGQPSA